MTNGKGSQQRGGSKEERLRFEAGWDFMKKRKKRKAKKR